MNNLVEYIKNIVIYIILTGFVTIIMPNNSYRKYIGLVMGMMLVEIVIEPFERGLGL